MLATLPDGLDEDVLSALDEAQIDAELGRRRLHNYVELTWPLVEAVPFIDNWHIGAICEHLQAVTEAQIENLLINIPPGCSKSLVTCVFWPSWEWARDGGRTRWMFSSYDQHLSTRDAHKTRVLIDTAWYKHRWPNVQISKSQDEKTYYETSAHGYRLSTSIGGHGTGEHPDRIVVDDPHNVKKAESEVERRNVIAWWDLTISLRGKSRGVRRVVIMQRLHENDLSGHILAKDQGFVHICLPMRYEPKRMVATPLGWTDPRSKPGDLMAPDQFPEKAVREMEISLGSYGTAGQLQQRPSPGEGGEIKRTWFRYYDVAPDKFDQVIQSWDTTMGDDEVVSDDAAYCVGQVWGRAGTSLYLLDSVRARMDGAETIAAIRNMSARWPDALAKLIENKAGGPAIKSILRHQVPGLLADKNRTGMSKVERVRVISPVLEAGHVYIPGRRTADGWEPGALWVSDFVEECATFPTGTFKDQVDAMSQAIAYLYRGFAQRQDAEARAAASQPPAETTEEILRRERAEILKKNRERALGNIPGNARLQAYRNRGRW